MSPTAPRNGSTAAEEAIALADEAGDLDLRVAIRGVGAYAQMCAGDLDAVDAILDEILELTGDDTERSAPRSSSAAHSPGR